MSEHQQQFCFEDDLILDSRSFIILDHWSNVEELSLVVPLKKSLVVGIKSLVC